MTKLDDRKLLCRVFILYIIILLFVIMFRCGIDEFIITRIFSSDCFISGSVKISYVNTSNTIYNTHIIFFIVNKASRASAVPG